MKIDIKENKTKILTLLSSTNRKGMPAFIEWLETTDFFEAPASAKWHLNVRGGLAYHSLSVYETFDKLAAMFCPEIVINTRIITALLHDVCKIGIYNVINVKGEYERDDTFPVGHGEKSVILLLRHGLKLNELEIAMIRWHMAMYDESYKRNSNVIKKVYPEAKLLYFADDISTQYLED